MAPLDQSARIEGRKAMESGLTKADRARRRLTAGRPGKKTLTKLTPLQAIYRAVADAEKARGIVAEEGLDPSDIHCEIMYFKPGTGSLQKRALFTPSIDETYRLFEFFHSEGDVLFLGVMWILLDREDPENGGYGVPSIWRSKFNDYPWNAEAISAVLEEERKHATTND